MRTLRISVSIAVVFAIVHGLGGAAAEPTRTESIVAQREVGGETVQSERDEQEALFNYYFRDRDLKYKTKLSDLSEEASVPNWRIPYSAAIHSEASGGLSGSGAREAPRRGLLGRLRPAVAGSGGSSPLTTYDRAFNGGTGLANAYELKWLMGVERALFPARRMRLSAESWEGYCSGFTGSTIKHPEPVKAVDAGTCGGIDWWKLVPRPGAVMPACDVLTKAEDDKTFLLYFVANSQVPNDAKLTDVKDGSVYAAEWFDPRTGRRMPVAERLVADAKGLVPPGRPDAQDWALILKRQTEP